jgi:hypothetical protein
MFDSFDEKGTYSTSAIYFASASSFLFVNYKFCLENSYVIGLFEIVGNKFRQRKIL